MLYARDEIKNILWTIWCKEKYEGETLTAQSKNKNSKNRSLLNSKNIYHITWQFKYALMFLCSFTTLWVKLQGAD